MKISSVLALTHKLRDPVDRPYSYARAMLYFADGFRLHITVGASHYSAPRDNAGAYTAGEVSTSEPVESWDRYCADRDCDPEYNRQHYAFLPFEEINAEISKRVLVKIVEPVTRSVAWQAELVTREFTPDELSYDYPDFSDPGGVSPE